MKRFYAFIAALFVLLSYSVRGNAESGAELDSIHISLLTCSPHDEVYSLYGHTALRIDNRLTGQDVAVNYGMFSFQKPFFVARFVLGLTDYEMGIVPFALFCQEYRYYGSSVTCQEINLLRSEKLRLLKAIDENYRPENRTYRYNFLYDNCTTRARDMVTSHIDGTVRYSTPKEPVTFRKLLHAMTGAYPWAQLGNDLLLGVGADREITDGERQFLPPNMQAAAATAIIVDRHGLRRHLVSGTTTAVEAGVQVEGEGFPLSPQLCSLLLLVLTMVVSAIEWRTRRQLYIYDAILLFSTGVAGLLLTVMLFSQHPTVSLNLQILLFNPLPLLFGWQAIRRHRHHARHWLWSAQILLIALMCILSAFHVQWIDPAVKGFACTIALRAAMKLYTLTK